MGNWRRKKGGEKNGERDGDTTARGDAITRQQKRRDAAIPPIEISTSPCHTIDSVKWDALSFP